MRLKQIRLFLIVSCGVIALFAFYKYTKFVITFGHKPITFTVGPALSQNINLKMNILREIKGIHFTSGIGDNANRIYPLTIGENMYIIRNNMLCGDVENISVLVMIHTACENFKRRESIRKTWGNTTLGKSLGMRIVFILGKPQNKSLQFAIHRESHSHQDIVQGNFIDTYHNLTNKAVFGLRWVSENCRQVKFVVKVDDDVFIHPFRLTNNLFKMYSINTRTIICDVRLKGTNKIWHSGKWKVEEKEFVNMTYWPVTYCPGFFVIYTGDIISELYKTAKITPFLWLDDVYVIGLLADKAGNISHVRLKSLRDDVAIINSVENMYKQWTKISPSKNL